jgi:hypothetical protein
MKHSEIQIIEKAKKVLQDVGWTYEEAVPPAAIEYDIERQVAEVGSQKKHPRFQEYVNTLFPYWSVLFEFPKEDEWGERNTMWVRIKDDTGEPYEIGHRQAKFGIVKKGGGKYAKAAIQ